MAGQTVALVVLIACATFLAVVLGRALGKGVIEYHRWALRQPRERRARRERHRAMGLCLRCPHPTMVGSDFCSRRCEADEDFENLD